MSGCVRHSGGGLGYRPAPTAICHQLCQRTSSNTTVRGCAHLNSSRMPFTTLLSKLCLGELTKSIQAEARESQERAWLDSCSAQCPGPSICEGTLERNIWFLSSFWPFLSPNGQHKNLLCFSNTPCLCHYFLYNGGKLDNTRSPGRKEKMAREDQGAAAPGWAGRLWSKPYLCGQNEDAGLLCKTQMHM